MSSEEPVLCVLTLLERKDGKMFAARLGGLNLTSYGYTPREAVRSVKIHSRTVH